MKQRKWICLACLLLVAALAIPACSLLPSGSADSLREESGETVTISREEYERYQAYAELDAVLQNVDMFYYQDVDHEKMIEYATRYALYALDDPYTFYYSPEEYAELWKEDEGEYAGIGIQIMASYETKLCTVTRVFVGSPAEAAGLHKGDVLVQVEDVTVDAYSLQEAVDIMRGKVGEPVNIQIRRGDEIMDFVINRAQVKVNWVNGTMLGADVGYIALYDFSGDCSASFEATLKQQIADGAKGLIIDLRDNPGGWVDDAVKMADLFLPKGVVVYLEDKQGNRQYSYATDGDEISIPIVLLVNENSASASEVLVCALKDYNMATVVGVQTYGKGIVQYVIPVGNSGAGMQVTGAYWMSPLGNNIHKVGVEPDVVAEMPEGDSGSYEMGDMSDAQLKAAFDTITQMIAGTDK